MGSVPFASDGTPRPGRYVSPLAVPTKRGLSSRSGHTSLNAPGAWSAAGMNDSLASGSPSPSSEWVTNRDPSTEAPFPTRKVLHAWTAGGSNAAITTIKMSTAADDARDIMSSNALSRVAPSDCDVTTLAWRDFRPRSQ